MINNKLPDDYEPCGECGYDHYYEYDEAVQWHIDNPCSYCEFKNGEHEKTVLYYFL